MTAKRGERPRFRAEPVSFIERRRRLPFHAEEVQILVYALDNRCAGEEFRLLLKVRQGFGAPAFGGEDLGVNFDRGAYGGRQVRIRIELARAEERIRHAAGFGRETVGLSVVARGEFAASQPRERGGGFGIIAGSVNALFGGGKVVGVDQRDDVIDERAGKEQSWQEHHLDIVRVSRAGLQKA